MICRILNLNRLCCRFGLSIATARNDQAIRSRLRLSSRVVQSSIASLLLRWLKWCNVMHMIPCDLKSCLRMNLNFAIDSRLELLQEYSEFDENVKRDDAYSKSSPDGDTDLRRNYDDFQRRLRQQNAENERPRFAYGSYLTPDMVSIHHDHG
jgi:hypothetical protein